MTSRLSFLAIISELVLWITLLAVIVLFAGWLRGHLPFQNAGESQVIRLKFKDVSQLAVGSPVQFMGTDIGFVTRVKPKGSRVEVTVETYRGAIQIPQGSEFTVEFNGLAGAKSLEIIPPDRPSSKTGFVVKEPVRLKDMLQTQLVMADALEYTALTTEEALRQYASAEDLTRHIATINNTIVDINQQLYQTALFLNDSSSRSHTGVQEALDFITAFSSTWQSWGPLLPIRIQQFANGSATHAWILSPPPTHAPLYRNLSTGVNTFNHQLKQGHTLSQRVFPQMIQTVIHVNTGLATTETVLTQVDNQLTHLDLDATLRTFKQQTRLWADTSRVLLNLGI